ncbi:hypothetical protein V1525DRAFT_421087 [Lipomyces kononenkoae]|uniref:Uncharacterized protein n=1 Tax=Lipomyces kononenkoae TaxID=34357 RepID=A0ACC3SX50_LIPKO
MSFIVRFLVLALALACWVSAEPGVSTTTLCLFKGHPHKSPEEVVFWVEEEYNQYDMQFYKMSDLGFSDFNEIELTLNDGTQAPALIYLYHNIEAATENVAFVNYDKTAYHFSGSEQLAKEKFKVVGGKKMVVDFGSCATPEESWVWPVKSSTATAAGWVARPTMTP